MYPSPSFTLTSTESRVLTKTLLDTLFNPYKRPTDHNHQPHFHQKPTFSSDFRHHLLKALFSRANSTTVKTLALPTMDVIEPNMPDGMKLDREKTLAHEPRQVRDFSGETLTEPSELPQPSHCSEPHGPSNPISRKEGQIANTPNLNSCEPHRSYKYIRSIKPKKCVNVNTRFGHRNGCLLCMFHVDHGGVSKPTHAQDVAPAVIEPQKLEEGRLESEHTSQEPEVEMSTNDEPDAEAQEVKSPDNEDLAKQDTPSVKNNAGDESSDKSPVIDLQSPVESAQPEHPPEDNATEAQIEDAISEEDKAADKGANIFEDALAPESQLRTGPASTLHPTEDATPDAANQTTSDDCKLIDDSSSTEAEISSADDEEKHAISSEQKDVATQEPPADAPVQTEGQKDENDTETNKKDADENNAIAQEHLVPEEEGTGLGHIFPFLNPEHNPERLENPLESDIDAEEQNATVIPEPSADGPVLTEEGNDEDDAKAKTTNADEANAVAPESLIPEGEGTGLGHVFPFENPNYEPESLENPHDAETYNMEQKDAVTPERPADVPAKVEERKDENSTLKRNMSIYAKVNKKKADDAKAVALESFAPEEEGSGLGHVFPFLNPDWAPESLENPHDAETAAKMQEDIDMDEEVPKVDLAASSETDNEDSLEKIPDKGSNQNESKDISDNETSLEPDQGGKQNDQKAPCDGESNDKVEEVIPSKDQREQTLVEPLHVEEQGPNENETASDAQTPTKAQELEEGPSEPASKSDNEATPGEPMLEAGKESHSESHVPNGEIDAPITKAVSRDPGLHRALPFRTKSEIAGATAADTTTDHMTPGEGYDQAAEENATSEEKNAEQDENDSEKVEEIKEADSVSPSDSPQPANNSLAPVERGPELEHATSDSSEKKQDQQCLPSTKPEDTQHPTEELQGSSAVHSLGAVEEVSLSGPNEPDKGNKDAASESSSGGSEYESFNDDDDTNGEDNLISQAVSHLRHETLNDRLIDRLVEDPERVGEIIAASAPNEEEEELKESEKFSDVPEDLALSDEDSMASNNEAETLNKLFSADEIDDQNYAANNHSQHDVSHDRLASSLAEDPIGVCQPTSARPGEDGALTVDLLAPSVPAVTNDDALPAEVSATLISAALHETTETINPEDDIQGHQQPAPAIVLKVEDEPKAKPIEVASPPSDTEAPIELDTTTPTVPTPTKSQQRRAQAKRAKERKAAERAAAANHDDEGVATASTASQSSEKNKFGKTNMTKRQIKRARQTRAKQRRMEAEKSSTQ